MNEASAAAQAILDWWDGRPWAVVAEDISGWADSHPLLAAADCLADAADSEDEDRRRQGLSALFGGLIEPLNDSFAPAGRAIYARIMGRILWRMAGRHPDLRQGLAHGGILSESEVLARHARVRRGSSTATMAQEFGGPSWFGGPDHKRSDPQRIAVLSRVTIGADALLTSVLLQRLRQRFPRAELLLLGDAKLAGLFGGLNGLRVVPVSYARRGSLSERLAVWLTLQATVAGLAPDLVVNPDSRLDQLGLLPLVDEARTLLWENLVPEGHPPISLVDLLEAWCRRVFAGAEGPGIANDLLCSGNADLPRRCSTILPRLWFDADTRRDARILVHAFGSGPRCAVKFDHGGNPAKSLLREAEVGFLTTVRERGYQVVLDRGFGAEELAQSDALLAAAGWTAVEVDGLGRGLGCRLTDLTPGSLHQAPVVRLHVSISQWAAAVSSCNLALSYDSVGHHLAAALGVPLVVVFTGFSDPGFPVAWQPRGPGRIVVVQIPVGEKGQAQTWQRVRDAVPVA